jgi:hypothetical protein
MGRPTLCLFTAILASGWLTHVSAARAAAEKVVYTFCSQEDCTDGGSPGAGLLDVRLGSQVNGPDGVILS